MPGRVDNVYLNAVVHKACVFGKNRDSALAFNVVRIHNALFNLLIFAENAALLKHCVNKRCLAVVNMRYYGNISYIPWFYHLIHSFLMLFRNERAPCVGIL